MTGVEYAALHGINRATVTKWHTLGKVASIGTRRYGPGNGARTGRTALLYRTTDLDRARTTRIGWGKRSRMIGPRRPYHH